MSRTSLGRTATPSAPGFPAADGRRARRTVRGERTRRRLLEAAERVFADHGYHDASIVKITEAAEVGQGTFYLYFRSKQEIFEELVGDLNHRVREAMAMAVAGARHRRDMERAGLIAFLDFAAEHPGLYSIITQADQVSPRATRKHYESIARPYAEGLRRAMDRGEIARADPEVLAWSLLAIGAMIGRRWVLWSSERRVPGHVIDSALDFINRGLGIS